MKKEFIEIQEEVRIPQKDHDLILEKGDRIKILQEADLPGYFAFDKAKRKAVYYTKSQAKSSEFADELKDYKIMTAEDFKWKGPKTDKVLILVNKPSEKSEMSMILKGSRVIISTAK